eukprot:m.117648 g.117648  ORF g.117648 m.117648 type:complete len:577 (+) comp15548_c0_seq3:939-2669(+)
MSNLDLQPSRLPEDGSVSATHVNLEEASQRALALHETEPCLRAQEMDSGQVPAPMKAASAAFWGILTAIAAKDLVTRYRSLPADLLAALTNVGVTAFTGDRTAIVASIVQVMSLSSTIVLALLSYCPVGRLAFGRPLRRAAVRLAHKLQRADATKLATIVATLRKLIRSPQGALGLVNALILPALERTVASATFPLAGVLRNVLAGLRLMLTTVSGVALATALHPGHLIPSNPWRPEPSFAQAQPPLVGNPVGVLICNLGTTVSPKPKDVASFLKEFLSDPRVVEIYPVVWQSVLNGLIIPLRKYTSGRLYARLFNSVPSTQGESPLTYYTRRFADRLGQELGSQYMVTIGMRYGEPSMRQGLDELKAAGCQKILVVPEYPQYSSTTSASIYDELFAQLRRYRNVPTVRIATPYYDHPAYIASLASVTKSYLADQAPVEKYIISFHGIPERYHLQGDPYPWHCEQTALALAEAMGWGDSDWVLTYQSVFGKDPWLRPATDTTVEALADQGLKRIAILCPGFLTDCLETVDENGTENADVFKEHGGEEVVLVPCLNDEPVWCANAAKIVLQETQGWV